MLSPAIITLPWRPDAAECYFAPLSATPWAMLLHSGFADHPYSRFDIIVAEPRATLVPAASKPGSTTVKANLSRRTIRCSCCNSSWIAVS